MVFNLAILTLNEVTKRLHSAITYFTNVRFVLHMDMSNNKMQYNMARAIKNNKF